MLSQSVLAVLMEAAPVHNGLFQAGSPSRIVRTDPERQVIWA
jgi:hypothetical protein